MIKAIMISLINKFAVCPLQFAIVFIASCVLTISSLKAQPNGGFENWTSEASYEKPDGWQTLNALSLTTPPNPVSTFKAFGFDKYSGNFALKLKTVYLNNNPAPSSIDDTTGVVFTGKINPSPFSYQYGFPYTARSEKLNFWYKYAPVGGDTGLVGVILSKWNGLKRDTIAFGLENIFGAGSFNLKQVTLTYNSPVLQPDSAAIVFASSKSSYASRVNSTLYIDDVAFTGWVGVDEQNTYANEVKVFPNPAKNDVTIQTQIKEADNVSIFDFSGKLVGNYKIRNNNVTVNTDLFAEGAYFYQLLDKKDKMLTSGKFNVIK